jgi:hypothetical protein
MHKWLKRSLINLLSRNQGFMIGNILKRILKIKNTTVVVKSIQASLRSFATDRIGHLS